MASRRGRRRRNRCRPRRSSRFCTGLRQYQVSLVSQIDDDPIILRWVNEYEVGQLTQSLCNGYFGYAGIAAVMRHPHANDLVMRLELENSGPASVPIQAILRKDGTAVFFSLTYALRSIAQSAAYHETHNRLWMSGALLTIGDALGEAKYFDKGPDLEFVRHLRNGVAHGNQFSLRRGEPKRPAHFTGPDQRLMPDGTTPSPGQAHTFEITRGLQGQPVLFDYVGPGDVYDLLMFVSWRLIRVGNGDPPLDLWPQRS